MTVSNESLKEWKDSETDWWVTCQTMREMADELLKYREAECKIIKVSAIISEEEINDPIYVPYPNRRDFAISWLKACYRENMQDALWLKIRKSGFIHESFDESTNKLTLYVRIQECPK